MQWRAGWVGMVGVNRGVTVAGEVVRSHPNSPIHSPDGAGRVMAYKYDIAGRLEKVSQVMGATANAQSIDASVLPANLQAIRLGEPKWSYYTALFTTAVASPHLVTSYAYDDLGRKISQTDARGKVTSFEYDSLGRQVKRTLPAGNLSTQMYYGTDGKMTHSKDFNGQFTKYVYFTSGIHFGKLQGKYPALGVAGQPDQVGAIDTSKAGVVYEYYDGVAGDPNGVKDFGRRKTVTYGGNQVYYLYDARGQLKERETRLMGAGGAVTGVMGKVAYKYDAKTGSKLSTTTYAGTTVTGTTYFKYDFEERLRDIGHSVSEPVADPNFGVTQLAQYDYNENGSLATVKRGGTVVNGVVTNPFFTSAFDYTAKNELLSIVHTGLSAADPNNAQSVGAVGAASRFYYSVDESGKRTGIANGNEWVSPPAAPTPPIPGTKYTYDLAGRLLLEEIPASTTGGVGKTVAYSYDKVGNRQTRTETPLGGTGVTTSYTYDDNDRLMTETKGADLISSVYDANGNLTSETHKTNNIVTKTIARAFTFEGKITKEETFVGVVRTKETTYNYDGEGNRIGVTRTDNNGGWTKNEYLVDTSQPYAEVIQEVETHSVAGGTALDPAGILYRYDIGLDRLRVNRYTIQANAPNGVGTMTPTSPNPSAWYVFDGLGSTRALVDNAGVVGADGAFGYEDAFGKPYSLSNPTSGIALTGFFLNGQQWDGSENLYFNRARYYQPQTGRFIGQDPFEGDDYEPSTLHRYSYAGNDSVNNTDPSGNETLVGVMMSTSFAGALRDIKNDADFTLKQMIEEKIGFYNIWYDVIASNVNNIAESVGSSFTMDGEDIAVAEDFIDETILNFSENVKKYLRPHNDNYFLAGLTGSEKSLADDYAQNRGGSFNHRKMRRMAHNYRLKHGVFEDRSPVAVLGYKENGKQRWYATIKEFGGGHDHSEIKGINDLIAKGINPADINYCYTELENCKECHPKIRTLCPKLNEPKRVFHDFTFQKNKQAYILRYGVTQLRKIARKRSRGKYG
jgi:RHS repeat-associated protein